MEKMYFIANFKKANEKRNIKEGVVFLGGASLVGQQTIRSGVPRLLGVRLESHSTNKKNATKILQGGGWLDPNRGGTGASKAINEKDFIEASKNQVHITGKHKNHKIVKEISIYKDLEGKVINKVNKYEDIGENIVRDIARRKFQRGLYRGIAGENINPEKVTQAIPSITKGLLGIKGKTLYIGGSDDYFNNNFTPDFDDLGLKSSNKIKVHGNRASATLEAIKREGGVGKLIKANPKRVLAGTAILGVGGTATAVLGKKAYKNLIPSDGRVSSYSKKNKSGRWYNVKSFFRKKIKKD